MSAPRRPRILFVHAWKPDPGAGGGQRLAHFFEAAQRIGEVTSFTPETYPVRPWPWQGPSRSDLATNIAMARTWRLASRRFPEAGARAFQALRPETYDVVILKPIGSIWRTGWLDPRRTLIEIDDVPSETARPAPGGNPIAAAAKGARYRWLRSTQRRLLDHYRFGILASEDDRALFDHPHAVAIPNVFWPTPAMDLPPLPPAEETLPLLFVGALFYHPNLRGLVWFVRQVLPRIRAVLPEAHLRVVGQTLGRQGHGFADWSWAEAPGVEMVGTVPDVAPHIREAQIEICPVLDGGGTRIKILESLAFAKPVVSTTLGAHGHPFGEAEGLLRCDDPEAFAQACIRLLRDAGERRRLGLAGRAAVADRHHPRVVEERLRGLVDTILQERGFVN